MLYSLISIIVIYAGAAAAEFSSRAVPAVLQTLVFMGRYISLSRCSLSHPHYFPLNCPLILRVNSLIYKCSPANALVEAFLRTDTAFRKELDSYRKSNRCIQKDWHPGCTAIAALVVRNKLFVANIGDCRAILCRAGNPIDLSKVS